MTRAAPAVLLLSGGLDSRTVLAIAQSQSFAVHALSFDYGQRHKLELEAAARIAQSAGVASHRVIHIDPQGFAGSALTREEIAVPKGRSPEHMAAGIPVTYVPARNTIFLAYALAVAESVGSADLFIGVNALDYSGYPDCRPEYIRAFEALANLATKAAVEGQVRLTVHTPLIELSKAQIIARGLALGVDYAHTVTCYDPRPEGACGTCDACLLRLKGFREAGQTDPAAYR